RVAGGRSCAAAGRARVTSLRFPHVIGPTAPPHAELVTRPARHPPDGRRTGEYVPVRSARGGRRAVLPNRHGMPGEWSCGTTAYVVLARARRRQKGGVSGD